MRTIPGGGTPPRGCQHHAAEIRESKGPITKRTKSHLPVVGSRIRHQISTSHMCFRADGHISVSERPQTRDFHRNRHPCPEIHMSRNPCALPQNANFRRLRRPKSAPYGCSSALPTTTPPQISSQNSHDILPYTKFRDSTEELATTRRGGVPAPSHQPAPVLVDGATVLRLDAGYILGHSRV